MVESTSASISSDNLGGIKGIIVFKKPSSSGQQYPETSHNINWYHFAKLTFGARYENGFLFVYVNVLSTKRLKQTFYKRNIGLSTAVGKKSVMSNFVKSVRKHMPKKTANKLMGREFRFLPYIASGLEPFIVFIRETYQACFYVENTVVADCDPMRIKAYSALHPQLF